MRTVRSRPIAGAALVLAGLGINSASVASAQDTGFGAAPARCQWAVADLPHTADAVEAWYRGCPPSDMPHSPTGVEGWTH